MILAGDVLEQLATLADESVNCCVTSPAYWALRDYGVEGQLGLEATLEEYVTKLVAVFREVRRVLRDDGTLWLVLGDSYAGGNGRSAEGFNERWHGKAYLTDKQGDRDRVCPARPDSGLKPKDLVGIPWRVAFTLQADGWYLRSDIIWNKPNPMPESVTDRPTKAHEYVFLMSKSERYYYDAETISEPSKPSTIARLSQPTLRQQAGSFRVPGKTNGPMKAVGGATRNRRSVWTIASQPFKEAHFATFPEKLVEPCVLAGCPEGGTVLDPFAGSGTTGCVAEHYGRKFIGIELKPEYCEMAERRIAAGPRNKEVLAKTILNGKQKKPRTEDQ